jgi:hypothetical protein
MIASPPRAAAARGRCSPGRCSTPTRSQFRDRGTQHADCAGNAPRSWKAGCSGRWNADRACVRRAQMAQCGVISHRKAWSRAEPASEGVPVSEAIILFVVALIALLMLSFVARAWSAKLPEDDKAERLAGGRTPPHLQSQWPPGEAVQGQHRYHRPAGQPSHVEAGRKLWPPPHPAAPPAPPAPPALPLRHAASPVRPAYPSPYAGDPPAYPGDPSAYPADPAARPADPSAYPGDPAAYPGDPPARPGDPAAQPSALPRRGVGRHVGQLPRQDAEHPRAAQGPPWEPAPKPESEPPSWARPPNRP